MAIYLTDEDALRSLRAAKFKNFKDSNAALSGAYLEDYAAIAVFLCDLVRFPRYLNSVSANLWSIYNMLPDGEGNRFTRAIGSMANDMGFSFQSHLKVSTPTNVVLITGDEPKFGSYVRNKLFWKDSMDGRHGEHSHSLQWLTIAHAEITRNSAADLYAKSVDFRCTNGNGEDIYLWSWLVDCFTEDMKGAATKLPGGVETLGSNSFRAPQYLMDYLMIGPVGMLSEHFVAQYLYWRYRNRNWLKVKLVVDPETYESHKEVTSIQEGDLKAHGIKKHSTTEWSPSIKKASSSKEAATIRSFSRVVASTSPAKPVKLSIPVTFHGRDGLLRFRNIE
ncbi:LirA/MavJ family T4SS effector [Rhodanobacter sp. Si-c]|uniref:LirA/MavJ family T4SS effector n=1 Tax=Rhodanobacter lycopersici TaxID=3162487 RepID=A0ABV3QAX3_9GAMM